MDTTTPSPAPAAGTEDKTAAILCYFTILGFIGAILIHSSKKTRLGAYHMRQMMGLLLTSFVIGLIFFVMACIPILRKLAFVGSIVELGMIVLWILGLVAAINGEMKPMPVLGAMFQKWFGTAFD